MRKIINKMVCLILGHKDIEREHPNTINGSWYVYDECVRCGRTK